MNVSNFLKKGDFLLKKFNEYIKFSAKGKKLYKFINALHHSHIYCFNQYCKDDIFYAEIYKKNLKIIRNLAEKFDISIEIVEFDSVMKSIKKYRFRFGIPIGIILSLFLCFYFSNTVMVIEINGNSAVKNNTILSVLSENGLKKGVFLSDIDYNLCERKLRTSISKISWSAIRHTGNRIVVDVTEIVDTPQIVQKRVPCNVIADKSAQITSVSVYSGQLMRIVGDYVRKGDILISGLSDNESGHTAVYHSMGDIIGIYDENITFTQPLSVCESVPSDNIKKQRYLDIFNVQIPLFIGKNKFKNYSLDSSYENFRLFGKSLPLGIKKDIITETNTSQITYSAKDAEKIIMEKMFIYEKNFLSDVKILDRKILKSVNENEITFNVTYSVEGNIGISNDIFVK